MTIPFTELLANLKQGDDQSLNVTITEDWMQGRTTYGGLSAALAYHAVTKAYESLPPLRSAQIAFIGPAGGDVTITPSLLRQGKSMSFIGADILGEKGLATRALFSFGAPRDSKFTEAHLPAPDVVAPEDTPSMYAEDGFRPSFTKHFESRTRPESRPCSSSSETEHFLWIRHEDKAANGLAALISLADMPPPAMTPKFDTWAPISSVTWTFNLTTENPETDDGWWLMRTSVEQAENGYSSQDMTIWNRQGELVLTARQSVAIFI